MQVLTADDTLAQYDYSTDEQQYTRAIIRRIQRDGLYCRLLLEIDYPTPEMP